VGRDRNPEGDRLADRRVGDGALHLPGDPALGEVKEEVAHPRALPGLAHEAVEERCNLGSNARQDGGGGKEGVEHRRTKVG
jgi:hypothetical protein